MSFEARRQGVLLIDDDESVLRAFRRCLDEYGYRVETAQTPVQAEAALSRAVFDVCVLDVSLGDESGMDLLPQLREAAPWMRVIMATGFNDATIAVNALQAGASNYLVKPCSPEQLVHAVAQQAETRLLEKRIEVLESTGGKADDVDLGTRNPRLLATFEIARQVADTDATILVLGESGCGKNVLARTIHGWSKRAKNVFTTVSCPSLSAELLESELFGHVRGAFTGAIDNRQGRVQVADGGTLFLDEIGDLPLQLQPKLLRFIQDHEYERVGDPHTRTADVRVIAATNRDLTAMVAEGKFREDLLYRLNVVTLTVPPLRERNEDIRTLAQGLLEKFVRQYEKPARRFSDAAANMLASYEWPGNLRELRNVVERAVILCRDEAIGTEHLPFASNGRSTGGGFRAGDPISIDELERAHIEAILSSSPTMEAAARTLGIDSSTLYRKRRQYNQS
jgi:NtrC-family two-component system response regulator AlgB